MTQTNEEYDVEGTQLLAAWRATQYAYPSAEFEAVRTWAKKRTHIINHHFSDALKAEYVQAASVAQRIADKD